MITLHDDGVLTLTILQRSILLRQPDPYELVASCIDKVFVGEDMSDDFTFDEAKEWVETLTNHRLKRSRIFNTVPSLNTDQGQNPNTKVSSDIDIEGLHQFFCIYSKVL